MPEVAKGLNDKFAGIRMHTISKIGTTPYKNDPVVMSTMEEIAKTDRDKRTKAAAIKYLVKNGDAKYMSIYQSAVNDSSYTVSAAALEGLAKLDKSNAYTLAKKYSADTKGALSTLVNDILIANGGESDFEIISKSYADAPPSFDKVAMTGKFADYLTKINDISKIKTGIDHIMAFRNMIPEAYRGAVDPAFKTQLDKISKAKGAEVENYVNSVFK
jgi:aminopeptidase N